MTYDELVTLIQNNIEYAEADFVAAIPQFIGLAEERIQRECDIPHYKSHTVIYTSPFSRFVSMPSDFLFVQSASVTSGAVANNLIPKEYDWLVEAYPDGKQGVPKYYAIYDDATIALGPTPTEALAISLTYNARQGSLQTSGTNWISLNAKNALLYGSLIYAATFAHFETEIVARYEQLYKESIVPLQRLGDVRSRQDDFRKRPRRPDE